uniref:NusG domain II-containing protein n=1 Tax=Desulfomonile tiedjei TaxID=2358 RepID=A0A7C4AQL0_9BACT
MMRILRRIQNVVPHLGHMTKADMILVAGIAASCLAIVLGAKFGKSGGSLVEISVQGKIYMEHDLARDAVIDVKGPLGTTVVQIANQRVRILSSPCRDKICVHMGTIDAHGGVLICAPNQVAVRIVNGKTETVDAFTR